MQTQKEKAIVAALLTALSMMLGWIASPYLIDFYFDCQPVLTIADSRARLLVDPRVPQEDPIYPGQTIVLAGTVFGEEYGTYIFSDGTGTLAFVPVLDHLNCVPSGYAKIAGVYNIVPAEQKWNNGLALPGQEVRFYALWTVGGCR